jgi:hypothetical protein
LAGDRNDASVHVPPYFGDDNARAIVIEAGARERLSAGRRGDGVGSIEDARCAFSGPACPKHAAHATITVQRTAWRRLLAIVVDGGRAAARTEISPQTRSTELWSGMSGSQHAICVAVVEDSRPL